MKIIRNAQHQVINIGAWDRVIERGANGAAIETNPLPAGAYEDEAEVVTGWDQGLYLADDPRRLGDQA